MRRWTGSTLVQIMACRLDGAKPLSEPMLTYCQLDPKEHISMTYCLKLKYFHSRKCVWTCRLRNGGHFVQGRWVKDVVVCRMAAILSQSQPVTMPTLQWRHSGLDSVTSLTIVYSVVYSDADQRKHQSSASLAFVHGIHRGPVNSPHKWPVTWKMFPFDDVIVKLTRLFLRSAHRYQWNTVIPQ